MIDALSQKLQVSVKEKHLKVLAFASIEEWDGEARRTVEWVLVRDQPSIHVTTHHLLVLRYGAIEVVTPCMENLYKAIEAFRDALNPTGLRTLPVADEGLQ